MRQPKKDHAAPKQKQSAVEYIWEKRGCMQQRREPIVRCRDCKHYEYWEFRDGRTAHDCARGGDYLFDTEPDGFCAWAERRES